MPLGHGAEGCYSGAEAKALEFFILELPFNGRALPAHLFQQKTPARTGA